MQGQGKILVNIAKTYPATHVLYHFIALWEEDFIVSVLQLGKHLGQDYTARSEMWIHIHLILEP